MKNEEKNTIEEMNEEMVGKKPSKFIHTLNKNKKVIIPVSILVLLISGIAGTKMKDGSFFKSPYGENYAYKDITDQNSRYLIPWESENYLVDIPLDMKETSTPKEIKEKNENTPDGNTGKIEDAEGNSLTPEGEVITDMSNDLYYGHEPSPNAPNTGNPRFAVVDRDKTQFKTLGNDLFNSIEVIDETWDVEKAIEVTNSNPYTKRDAENIKSVVGKLIKGNFNWNYKNEDNKLDYLSFRVGEYIYDNRISSVPLIYERMQKKVKDNKMIITPSYNEDEVKVYIHPTLGGYTVDVPVTLHVNENGNETTKELHYLSQFGYRTPSPADIWQLWATRVEGVYMIGDEYSLKDLKGGN